MDKVPLSPEELEQLPLENLRKEYTVLAAEHRWVNHVLTNRDQECKRLLKQEQAHKALLKKATDVIHKLCGKIVSMTAIFGQKRRETLENIWNDKGRDFLKRAEDLEHEISIIVSEEVLEDIPEEPAPQKPAADDTGDRTVGAGKETAKKDGLPITGDSETSGPTSDKDTEGSAQEGNPGDQGSETSGPTSGKDTEESAQEGESGDQDRDDGSRREESAGSKEPLCPGDDHEQPGAPVTVPPGDPQDEKSDQKGDTVPSAVNDAVEDNPSGDTVHTKGSDTSPDHRPDETSVEDQNDSAAGSGTENVSGDDHGQEGEAKKRGNPNLGRQENFLTESFFDVKNLIIEVDPLFYTRADILEKLAIEDDLDQIRFSSDVQTYLNAKVVDGRIYPVLHVSLKFRNGDSFIRNPHKGRPLRSSICSRDVVALMASLKHNLGLPMNRIENHLFENQNLNIQRATVENWIRQVYEDGLKYLRYAMLEYMLQQKVLIMDETFINSKEHEGNSYYWSMCTTNLDPDSLPLCLFTFDPSRSVVVPNYYLQSYAGIILADGYGVYVSFVKDTGGEVRLANCWKHFMRPLEKCLLTKEEEELYEKNHNGEKHWALKVWLLIQEMFEIEKPLKSLSPEARLEKRKEKMFEKADSVRTLLKDVRNSPLEMMSSYAKETVEYFCKREVELFRIFEDGRVPLSTNELESKNNMIALGRNGWMAYETDKGSEIGGTLFSFAASARLAEADVLTFINFMLETLPYIMAMYSEEEKEGIENYYAEFEKKLAEAHLGKKKEDKLFKPEEMVHPKPDLSPFFILFPNTDEHKAYVALKEKEADEQHAAIAKALTLLNIEKSPITTEQMLMVLETLQKRIEKGTLAKDFGYMIDYLKEILLSSNSLKAASAGQVISFIDMILEENDLSEDCRKSFGQLREYLTQEKGPEDEKNPPQDVLSTSNFTFEEHDEPEYLRDPAGLLKRLNELGYGCKKEDPKDEAEAPTDQDPCTGQDGMEQENGKETDSDTGTGAETETDTGTETKTDTGAGTETETGTDTGESQSKTVGPEDEEKNFPVEEQNSGHNCNVPPTFPSPEGEKENTFADCFGNGSHTPAWSVMDIPEAAIPKFSQTVLPFCENPEDPEMCTDKGEDLETVHEEDKCPSQGRQPEEDILKGKPPP